MSFWSLVARAIYEAMRVAGGSTVTVRDEGGLATLRSAGACLVIANHCSHADTPILLYAMPRARQERVRFIAGARRFGAESAQRGPGHRIAQWFMNRLATRGFRAVLVGADTPGHGAIEAITGMLRAGETVVLYPEGTRSRTGALGPIRQGIAHLMQQTDSPVVPARIDGTHAAMPAGSVRFARHSTITVRFRSPLVRIPGESSEQTLARVAEGLSPQAVVR